MQHKIPQLKENYDVKLNTEGVCFGFLLDSQLFPTSTCSIGKWGLTITPEGYVIPCLGARVKPESRKPAEKYILAKYDKREENILKSVWENSVVLKDFRNMSTQSHRGKCEDRPQLPVCKGGCPIRREMFTGNI